MIALSERCDGYTIMECGPCETVHTFAAHMIRTTYEDNQTVLGSFNQHTLEAHPGDTTETIVNQWWALQLPFEKF